MRHVTCLKPWFRDGALWRGDCCCSLSPPKLYFSRPLKIRKIRCFLEILYIYSRGLAPLFAHLPGLFRKSRDRHSCGRFANLSPCAAKSVMEIGLFTREHQLACPVVSIKIGLFARDHHTHWPGRSRSSHKLARSLAIIIII